MHAMASASPSVRPSPAGIRARRIGAARRSFAMSASASTSPVGSVLGTMTFGWKFASEECDDGASLKLMETFLDAGHVELDTALAYSGGET
jgi:hypothetical protein